MRQGRKAKNAIDCFSCNPSLSLESESGQGHSLDPSSSLEPPSPRRTNTVDLKLPHSKWNLEKVFHLLLTGPHRSRRYRPCCRRMGCGLSWEPPRPHHAASPNIPRQSSIAVNAVHASHCAFPGPLLFTLKHKQARPRPGPRSCEKLRPAKRGMPVRRLESSPIHRSNVQAPSPSHSPPTKDSPQQTYPIELPEACEEDGSRCQSHPSALIFLAPRMPVRVAAARLFTSTRNHSIASARIASCLVGPLPTPAPHHMSKFTLGP